MIIVVIIVYMTTAANPTHNQTLQSQYKRVVICTVSVAVIEETLGRLWYRKHRGRFLRWTRSL